MKKLVLCALLGLSAVPLSGCVPVIAVGVGAAVVMAEDRRTSGTYLMDQEIELKLAQQIRESVGDNTHINATSFNRRVMLTGQVPDTTVLTKVQEIAKSAPNVREVQNELAIGAKAAFPAITNDSYITTKVKARFLDDKRFDVNHIKVVTEASTVYLMGMVKREEGNAAAEIAARTSGVSKVVKVFEYMD
jgi:osmotically-inducible protein OsmY